jgi:ERCC4-type nuclease
MLSKSIAVLTMLSPFHIERLQSANIVSIGDLFQMSEADLIQEIYGVGPARARKIKNALDAELLEYLSG